MCIRKLAYFYFHIRRAVLPYCQLRFALSQRSQSTGRWWSQPGGFLSPIRWHPGSPPWQTALLYRALQMQQLWGCTCRDKLEIHVEENSFLYAASCRYWTWDCISMFALYLLSSCTMEVSLCPLITICCSFSCFATWDTHHDISGHYQF